MGNGSRLVVVLAMMGFSAAWAFDAQSAKAKISGRVMTDTGRPVKYATVQLYAELSGTMGLGGNISPSTVTDKNGHFNFEDLPPGTYRLNMYQVGYLDPSGSGEPPLQVVVEEGPEITDLEVVLVAGGAVTGRVLDEDGDPIINTPVMAWNKQENGYFQQMTQAQTDDRGVYRLFGLRPGEYVIGLQIPARGGQRSSSGLTYYPGVLTQKEARVISVSSGGEVAGIDFSLQPGKGGKLVGRVTVHSTNKPVAQVPVGLSGESFSLSTTTASDGSYEFTDLPQGTFQLYVTPAQKNIMPLQKQVKIESQGTTRVDVQVEEGAEISGLIELIGNRPMMNSDQLYVNAEVVALEGDSQNMYAGSQSARVSSDSTFVVGGLPSARIRFTIQAPNNRYFLKAVHQGDTECRRGEVSIRAGKRVSDIRLILSDEVGDVRGLVRQHEGPAKPCQVVLVPAEESQWNDYRTYRTGWSNGQEPFIIQGVPAGRYLMFAVESSVGFSGEPFIRKYQSSAIELTIRPGETQAIEVAPLTAEELGLRQ
jgi:hypothetical protein